jgi:hypothetical protein
MFDARAADATAGRGDLEILKNCSKSLPRFRGIFSFLVRANLHLPNLDRAEGGALATVTAANNTTTPSRRLRMML